MLLLLGVGHRWLLLRCGDGRLCLLLLDLWLRYLLLLGEALLWLARHVEAAVARCCRWLLLLLDWHVWSRSGGRGRLLLS